MQRKVRRLATELAAVTSIPVFVLVIASQEWFPLCCEMLVPVFILPLYPGIIIGWIIGGGPHAAGLGHAATGVVIEFLLLWALVRGIARAMRKKGRADA